MGTRCDIYLEHADETYIGVQCFFDGYPEHILRELNFCSYSMLKDYIVVGGSKGGINCFYPSKGETEFAGQLTKYIYDPHSMSDADFVYVMKYDRSVHWRAHGEQSWRTGWEKEQ